MPLRRIADIDVAVPVRFGSETSVEHRLLLRFGPLERDGSVRGHVLAQVGGTWVVARDAIVWDPVLRGFAIGDQAALEKLAGQLDPTSAVLGGVGHGVLDIVQLVSGVLVSALSPNVMLVGSVGALLLGVFVYYWLWSVAFTWAVCWVILPGFVATGVTLAVRDARLNKLYTELLRAADASLGAAPSPW